MTDMGSAMGKTFLALLMLAGLLRSSRAATYKVGGSKGWTLGVTPTFYDDWVANMDLVEGDVLVFPYPSNTHNVFEVTKADLTSCNIDNPIKTYDTLGGASVTVSSGYHAYICGIPGHCAGFMKMNVQVGTGTAPTVAPVAAPTIAPPATNGTIPITPPAPAVNATSPTTSPAPTANATSPTAPPAPVPVSITPPSAPPALVPSAATPAPSTIPPLLSPPAPIAPTPTTTPIATAPGTLASAPGPSPGENSAGALLRSTPFAIAGIILCALRALMFY